MADITKSNRVLLTFFVLPVRVRLPEIVAPLRSVNVPVDDELVWALPLAAIVDMFDSLSVRSRVFVAVAE